MSRLEEPPPLPPEYDIFNSESEVGWLQRFVHQSLLPSRVLESLLGRVQRLVSPALVINATGKIEKIGHILLPQLATLLFVFGILLLIDGKHSRAIGLMNVGLSILLLLGQFVAMRMFKAIRVQIAATPGTASSRDFLDTLAMIGLCLTGFAFVAGFVFLIDGEIVPALGLFVGASLLLYQSICALHPSIVYLYVVESASSGQTALGILGLFLKSLLSLSPVVYGATTLLVWLAVLVSAVKIFSDSHSAILTYGTILTPLGLSAVSGAVAVPIGVFVLFLLGFLFIDLMEAILRIPSNGAFNSQNTNDVPVHPTLP
jgi:hypothetical protein